MIRQTILSILSIFLFLSAVYLPQAAFSTESELTVAEFVERADQYILEEWEHRKALDLLYDTMAEHPENDEILWRISRAYIAYAEKLLHASEAESEEVVEDYYESAKKYADRAININPNNSMAYTQRAIASAQLGIYRWVWSAIGLVKNTRDDAEKAIELDDSNDIAHFVYARTHAEVRSRVPWGLRRLLGFGWADMDTALSHFDRAIELNPDFIMYRLYAAEANINAGRERRAYELLTSIPEMNDQTFLDKTHREKASEMLAGIKERRR